MANMPDVEAHVYYMVAVTTGAARALAKRPSNALTKGIAMYMQVARCQEAAAVSEMLSNPFAGDKRFACCISAQAPQLDALAAAEPCLPRQTLPKDLHEQL